jgi:hypothetical protein
MTRRILLGAGLAALVFALPAPSQAGKGTIDAASMTIRVHKFGVATSGDCKNPIIVFTSDAGVENDLISNPTYGAGPIDPGTYNCVVIELSKVIKTSGASTAGSCVQGREFADVICHDGQTSQLVDGTPVTCSGGAANAQHVTLFATTASAGTSGDRALLPPTDASDTTSGLKLTGPLVVVGNMPVTLTVDPKQFLDGTGTTCGTSAPTFGVN